MSFLSQLFSWSAMPYELLIGMRYTRAKRKNHFISFISIISVCGTALGVAALIIVLYVMNGFQSELSSRILGVASHIEITQNNNRLSQWQALSDQLKQEPDVDASAPYIMAQGMLSYGQSVQGALIRGVLPQKEDQVADLGKSMQVGHLNDLQSGSFNIVLGSDLAYALGISVGDKVVLMAPQGQFTPAGVVPRIKQFTVSGLFQIGMYEYDAGLALIHMDDAAKLYRMGKKVSGVRLKINDLYAAPEMTTALNNSLQPLGAYYIRDWTQQHANFFKAVKTEKRVMFIILTIMVAVATFNIISTLVMAVTDKRADIAIMRTLGASPRSIMSIFMTQGLLIGVVGTILGALFGILVALNIDTIVPFIEQLFQVQFLAKDVYYISDLPSKVELTDIIAVTLVSIILSFIMTVIPSYWASHINPAEALRYE